MPVDIPSTRSVTEQVMPVEDLPEIFNSLDTIGDGKIFVDQLGTCLRVAGLTPTEAILVKMTKQWAENSEARLSVQDVTPIYTNVKKEMGTDAAFETIHACLSHFDREGNGTITHADLRYILCSSGERLSDRELEQIIQGFFAADESNVSITELVKHIQSL
ncbi:unnamed protein product, partial [Mesorhabditis belari]|uniref:EF-hand domain-containing protein n=1 Tax=Mesorhabditis belari TaxID=2138241 RepID=A0AAF3FSD4_9BILA